MSKRAGSTPPHDLDDHVVRRVVGDVLRVGGEELRRVNRWGTRSLGIAHEDAPDLHGRPRRTSMARRIRVES